VCLPGWKSPNRDQQAERKKKTENQWPKKRERQAVKFKEENEGELVVLLFVSRDSLQSNESKQVTAADSKCVYV